MHVDSKIWIFTGMLHRRGYHGDGHHPRLKHLQCLTRQAMCGTVGIEGIGSLLADVLGEAVIITIHSVLADEFQGFRLVEGLRIYFDNKDLRGGKSGFYPST